MKHDSSKGKEAMLDNLHKALGNITIACKNTGIARQTYYDWLSRDKDFAAAVDEVMEERGDFVENALDKLIQAGNPAAIIFYCKTKLKNRGFVERQEIDASIADSTMTIDELKALIAQRGNH